VVEAVEPTRAELADVTRAIAGDHDAFAALANANVDRMFALARAILRDVDRAEDATQEALVRAWRELPRLRDPGRFRPWLRRLLVNACYDEGRRLRAGAKWSCWSITIVPFRTKAAPSSIAIASTERSAGCPWNSESSPCSITSRA
jgi:DNA-directed RNA polymerase specialized sigma24 family protein